MIVTTISVDDNSQSFEMTHKNNHSVTAPSAHFLLGCESLKYQDNNTTHMPGQKIPPTGK